MATRSQCSICDKYMAESGQCYDTRHEPNYNEEECLRFRELGTPSTVSYGEQKKRLPGFLQFYLWYTLGLGSIGKIIILIASVAIKELKKSWIEWFDWFFNWFMVALAIYVIYAFVKRKRNAIALAKAQLIIQFCMAIPLLTECLMEGAPFSNLIKAIAPIVWAVIFFWYICTSDLVKQCIPTEKRGLLKRDIIIIVLVCSVYLIVIMIGIMLTFLGLLS